MLLITNDNIGNVLAIWLKKVKMHCIGPKRSSFSISRFCRFQKFGTIFTLFFLGSTFQLIVAQVHASYSPKNNATPAKTHSPASPLQGISISTSIFSLFKLW